jgi:hypothetical protein
VWAVTATPTIGQLALFLMLHILKTAFALMLNLGWVLPFYLSMSSLIDWCRLEASPVVYGTDRDGKGDYYPKKRITDGKRDPNDPSKFAPGHTSRAKVFSRSLSEWQSGSPRYYQYPDFDAEVWCVQCKGKKTGGTP